MFRDAREAYINLSDPDKKRMYDAQYRAKRDNKYNLVRILSLTHCARVPKLAHLGPYRCHANLHPSVLHSNHCMNAWVRNFTKRQIPKGERIEGLNVELVLSPEESAQGGIVALGVPVFFHLPPVQRHRSRVALPLRKLRRSRHHRSRENGPCAYSAYATRKIRY